VCPWIKEILASRIKVNFNDFGVVRGEIKTWEDGSFGCLEEGRSKAEVLRPCCGILLARGGPAEIEALD